MVKVVSLTDRIPTGGMEADDRAAALESVDELRALIEKGEVDSVAWVASSAEYVHQAHYGIHNNLYQMLGAIGTLQAYLTSVFHLEQFDE